MNGSRWLLGTVTLVLAFALAAPAAAQVGGSSLVEGTTNVQLTFKMGMIENGKKEQKKFYTLIVAEGPVGSKLLAGERVPFPGGGEGGSIVYQNIGFATEARVWIVDDTMIKVVADIEDSRVVDGDGAPKVETRQLSISAVLTDGEALELTRVEGLTDVNGYVELEAKLLR